MKSTINSGGVSRDQLRAFIERIERMNEEKRALNDDLKEIYAEAKGNGYDTKAIKIVVRERAMDHSERMELEAIVDLYRAALGMQMPAEDDDEPSAPAPAREIIEEFDPETGEITEPAAPATTPPGAIAADLSDEGTNSAQPEPLSSDTQSTAARMDVPHEAGDAVGEILNEAAQPLLDTEAGTQAPPVDIISEPDKSARPSGDGLAAPLAFKPYDGPRDSQGLARPYGCLDLECCHSSTWRHPCHSCAQALAVKAGGTPIPHQGEVA